MVLKYIMIILSSIALLITLILNIKALIDSIKGAVYPIEKTIYDDILSYQQYLYNTVIEKKDKQIGDTQVIECLNRMINVMRKLYSNTNFHVSIKIIDIDTEDTSNSLVRSWIDIGGTPVVNDGLPQYTIKDNTDFYSVFIDKHKYFFVSDINEYANISKRDYKNQNPNWRETMLSTIVYPIKNKNEKVQEQCVGFLCVDSPQRLDDNKRNVFLMNILEITAYALSSILTERFDIS